MVQTQTRPSGPFGGVAAGAEPIVVDLFFGGLLLFCVAGKKKCSTLDLRLRGRHLGGATFRRGSQVCTCLYRLKPGVVRSWSEKWILGSDYLGSIETEPEVLRFVV